MVPVVFALVDEVADTAVDGKPKTTNRLQRVADVAATGRAGLFVDEYAEDWSSLWWSATSAMNPLWPAYPPDAVMRPTASGG